jgi:hypothetical protein
VEESANNANVLRVRAAEQDVASALRDQLPVRRNGVELVRVDVTLSVDEETTEAAKRLERIRHEYELDELARRQAKARADFLRDVMLADPASADLYTMLELPPRLGGPTTPDGLEELVRKVKQWHPQSRWVLIAQILYEFLDGLSESGRKDLINIIHGALAILGTAEQAAKFESAVTMPEAASDRFPPRG